jgi:hypothetical protein
MRRGRVSSGEGKHGAAAVRWTSVCAIALFLMGLLTPTASANTTLFSDDRICGAQNCQALSYYGVFLGYNSSAERNLTVNGDWLFNSGIGISGNGTNDSETLVRNAGTTSVSGLVDFANPITTGTSCTGTTNNVCGSGALSGTSPTNANSARVLDADSQLDAILAVLGGGAYNTGNGTTTALPTTSGGGETDVTAGLSGGTLKIYRNTSAYTTSGTITLGCGVTTCDADMLVVIHLTGGTTSIMHNIVLNDGLTPDQVVFYIPTNTLNITPTAAGITARGTFILGTGSATVVGTSGASDPVSVYGRLYADTGNITFNDKGTTANQTFSDPGISPIPEPGTWAMMAGGFAAMLWGIRRKSKKLS